jgi:hypothetical protein
MICPACGSQNAPAATFCNSCGTALTAMPGRPMPGPGHYYAPPMATHTSGMAIAGFVLSFFCAFLGLIFSILGHNEIKRGQGRVTGGGLAVAGIVISSISLVLWSIWMIAFFAALGGLADVPQ